MINCIIIEDEPLAQRGLTNLIKKTPELNLVAVCDEVQEFLAFREANKEQVIDLLFLDIELPGMNGISFLRNVPPGIPVVLTTAYHQYALEGYELNVLDYLLKPIAEERFAQMMEKVKSYIGFLKAKTGTVQDFIYVRSEKVIEKVYFSEIFFVEAMRNYVLYNCETRTLVCYNSLKNVEQSLPQDQFIKVQKSFIINKNKIEKIEKGFVQVKNKKIAMARDNKAAIIKRLMEES